MTMQQCETMIDALQNAGINVDVYAEEFCNQVALPPSERFFGELVDILEDMIREENLIAVDTLEQMKWVRYEEFDMQEEVKHSKAKLLVQWLEGYGNAQPRVVSLSQMLDSDEWGLDIEFLYMLHEMAAGQIHDYHDPSGVIRFQKAPTLKGA